MMKKSMSLSCLALLTIFFLGLEVNAAPISQSITLHPGWNAIFLELEPGVLHPNMPEGTTATDPVNVFSQINNLQAVWKWNSLAGTVEFIQNPDPVAPGKPQMLVYIPGNDVVTNLFAIQGKNAYLVQLGGSVDQVLTIEGEPAIPRQEWKANSFNFVGFHLAGSGMPTFASFFDASPAHAGQEIYVLDNPTSTWVLADLGNQMKQGEAFWIYCNGSSSYNGPVTARLEQFHGLHYGTELSEQEVVFENDSLEDRLIELSLPVPLQDIIHYWVFDPVDGVASWEPLPSLLNLDIAAGKSQRIRLGVKRTGLVADQLYETNLEVASDGYNFQLPMSLTGIDYDGLWTGYARINKVSDQNRTMKVGDVTVRDNTPVPTGPEFSFRLIVHAEDNGTVRLLSQVIQMWQEGTWKPDPDNLGRLIIDEPGDSVLLTDDTLVSSYTGASLRDGQPVGRRISAPVFPRISATDAVMNGTAAGASFSPVVGNDLSLQILLEKDDPTNPFRHLFHMAHENIDPLTKVYEVTRTITLTFADEDGDGQPITGLPKLDWGSAEIGGIYTEQLSGLHKEDIYIEGTFVLHRVSDIATLTQ